MRSIGHNREDDERSLDKWTNEFRAKAEAEEIKEMRREDIRSRKALQHVGQPPVNVMDWTKKGVVTPVKNREQQP